MPQGSMLPAPTRRERIEATIRQLIDHLNEIQTIRAYNRFMEENEDIMEDIHDEDLELWRPLEEVRIAAVLRAHANRG